MFAIVSVANGGRPLAFDLCLLQHEGEVMYDASFVSAEELKLVSL